MEVHVGVQAFLVDFAEVSVQEAVGVDLLVGWDWYVELGVGRVLAAVQQEPVVLCQLWQPSGDQLTLCPPSSLS